MGDIYRMRVDIESRLIEQIQELEAKLEVFDEMDEMLRICLNANVDMAEKLDRVRGLLKVAKCPNSDCENGAIPHGPTPDGGWEWEQCQWCHELQSALGDEDGS